MYEIILVFLFEMNKALKVEMAEDNTVKSTFK